MKPYAALGALASLLTVAACGGGGGAQAAQPQATTPVSGQQGQQSRFPGASGLLASIDGTTLQVQSSTAQTAVTYTAKTTFTDTVRVAASAVTVGSCVQVRDGQARVRTTSAPTSAPTQATTVSAATVVITAPVNGSCAVGGGFGRPGGFTRPSGAPTFAAGGRPPGGFGGGFGGGGAFGKVTATTAQGFVVASTRPGATTSTAVTVTTTAATTYTADRKATSKVLKVGECLTARGTSDTTGTVAATAISLRPATNGSCDQGFGPRG